MTRRVTVRDWYGTAHIGPPGSWWLPVRDGSNEFGTRPRAEIPTFRRWAWNVAAVAYAAGAVILASRLGELAPFLVGVAVLVVVGVVGLWWIHATMPARYARQIGRPIPRKARHAVSAQTAPVLTAPSGVAS